MWLLSVGVGLCFVGVFIAAASAASARDSATVAVRNSVRARSAATDAEISARTARTVTGIDFSFDQAAAAAADPSHRIWQDMRTAAATAQRLSYRAGTPRTPRTSPVDVFVKPNP